MKTPSDLVERLRRETDLGECGRLCDEAADEIARLTAQVERLRKVHESELGVCERYCDVVINLQAVVDAARKQNDYRKGRLKAANGFLVADELDAALRALDGEPSPADKLEAWAHQEPGRYDMKAMEEDLAGRGSDFKERDGEP